MVFDSPVEKWKTVVVDMNIGFAVGIGSVADIDLLDVDRSAVVYESSEHPETDFAAGSFAAGSFAAAAAD